MQTLVLHNLSRDTIDRLKQRAAEQQRTPAEEAAHLLEDVLQKEAGTAPVRDGAAPLPDYVPGEEISPPCDLPIPDDAKRVPYRRIDPPLPNPPIIEEDFDE